MNLFSDADFAGDTSDYRSTSGVFLAVVGPNSLSPQMGQSKKQTSVSHSTPEAEMVAADLAVRQEGLPALDVWETLLMRVVQLTLQEDNKSAIAIIRSGRNPAIRHMSRTHGVNVSWLHEQLNRKKYSISKCDTNDMSADIFTKSFTDAKKWDSLLRLINHLSLPVTRVVKAPSNVSAALPASAKADGVFDRVLIEFCCESNSLLGQPTPQSKGCKVVRLTKEVDMTSAEGLKVGMDALKHSPKTPVFMWSSMPCTGGSQWRYMNAKRPNGLRRLAKHIELFDKLWESFVVMAEDCLARRGSVALEWPKTCYYFKLQKVNDFFSKHNFDSVLIHGCSLGLVHTRNGVPILKPWIIWSNCQVLLKSLQKWVCPGKDVHPIHELCQGDQTAKSGEYTPKLASICLLYTS